MRATFMPTKWRAPSVLGRVQRIASPASARITLGGRRTSLVCLQITEGAGSMRRGELRWLGVVIGAGFGWVLGVAVTGLAGEGGSADAGRDVHSYGNPLQIRVKSVDLDLTVSFEKKELSGTAGLVLERQPGCPNDAPLMLDTKDLTIQSVKAGTMAVDVVPVPFEVAKAEPILGSALTIRVPPSARYVQIAYHTSPNASALQWVGAAQTAGGKHPFLFSQSEAILVRSWIPLQDSPAARVSYRASIRTQPGLKAVMSADSLGHEGDVYRFAMPETVAPYLIALAVGDIEFRPLGKRTGVWAEPSVVGKAAHEFVDTEKMVEAAEKRFGSYRWGRYDILVLPPSFPFGGMENAKLTFATPTVLAGDRSMVSLIAHELAHSWSGNLVTNATWRDFWLNEGFTTYLERRIVEDLYGETRAAMERVLGDKTLHEELAKFDKKDQILHIDLTGRDPDDGMTRVPYEKGAAFLSRLEAAFGREAFDTFLRGYFDHFAFKSITTAEFEAYLRSTLFAANPATAQRIDLNAWLHQPGMPTDALVPTSPRFAVIEAEASAFAAADRSAKDLPTNGWSTLEWVHFLRALPPKLSAKRLADLDKAFGLTNRENTEIAEQWLLLAIRNGYAPADARLEQFLTTIGRRKYLMPLYEALAKTSEGRSRAKAIFAKARPFYHPISSDSVARLLDKP